MTAAARAATRPRARATASLRWGTGSVRFELHAADPAVLERAREVFGPWLTEVGPPPLATFAVEPAARGQPGWRVAGPESGEDAATVASVDLAVAAVEYRAVAALLAPDSGVVAVHAALVSRAGRGLLLAGPKEAGKTTLACALWARGWSLHADDTALIEGGALARGVARRVSLRTTSRSLLGPELDGRIDGLPATTLTATAALFHPREVEGTAPTEPVAVAAVVFLARRDATPRAARAEPLEAARGLLALAPYCNVRDAGMGRAIAALQPLADRARFFDLGRDAPARMAARLEEAIGR